MLRDRASIRAIVCSAVLSVLPAGVFITTMPQRVAAVLVDVVGADAGPHDRLQPPIAFERVGRDLHAAAADRAVELRERFAERVALEAGADLVLNARRGRQHVEAFLSERVENNDAGHEEGIRFRCRVSEDCEALSVVRHDESSANLAHYDCCATRNSSMKSRSASTPATGIAL